MRDWFADAWQDARYAVRQAGRTPVATSLLVATLALGIGANAAMTAAIDRLLFRAPPKVANPDRVVRLLRLAQDAHGASVARPTLNYPTLLDLQRDAHAFEAVAGHTLALLSFGTGPEARRVRAKLVSSAFFSVLGIVPHLGTLFVPSDADEARHAVASHAFWQSVLGSDSTAIGRTVRIGSIDYTIIGVAAAGFRGLDSDATEVWLPLTVAAERDLGLPISLDDRASAWLAVVGRLRPGVSQATAEAQATEVWRAHRSGAVGTETTRIVAASIVPGRGPDRAREANVALWLAGVSILVLLLACAHVANLLLARTLSRRREIATRLAMGASLERLVRQQMTETALLAFVGGVTALALAAVGSGLLQTLLFPESPAEPLINPRVLAITATVATIAAVLIGLAPVVQSARADIHQAMRSTDPMAGGNSGRLMLGLLGAEGALCMFLLMFAGLFAYSFHRVHSLDLGFDPERTVLARVDLGPLALPRSVLSATYESMLQRVRDVPGVRYAALASRNPFSDGSAIPAHTPARSEEELWHREGLTTVPMEVVVDSGFFRALGTKSLRGRDFGSQDRLGAQPVAIVNQPLARILWPGDSALGNCMLITFEGGDCVQIVGVVGGYMRRSILERDQLLVYVPMAQKRFGSRPGSIIVSVDQDSDAAIVASRVRAVLQAARPDLPAIAVDRMSDHLAPEFRTWKVAAAMFSIFAGLAFVVAMIGLYAVVEYTTSRRTRETAIRLALGASTLAVLREMSGAAVGVVLLGVLLGLLATLALRSWIGAQLFETSPADPRIIFGVGAILATVAVIASIVPTWRVIRLNPAASLGREDQ